MTDDHDSMPIAPPYQNASFVAQQRYIYICPCANNGQPVVLLGIHDISRSISQRPDGKWQYTITKTGLTGTRILP